MDKLIEQLADYGPGGVLAAIAFFFYLKGEKKLRDEQKEHREDLLRIVPLIERLDKTIQPAIEIILKGRGQ